MKQCTTAIVRIILLLVALMIAMTTTTVVAQSSVLTTTNSDKDLEALSDGELEAICTNLGFQVIREDPETGAAIEQTHEHYVEAARQCLEIQKEMEQILEQHPELRKEYEEAMESLIAEQSLEHERLLKQKEELESQLETQKGGEEDTDTVKENGTIKEDILASSSEKEEEEAVVKKVEEESSNNNINTIQEETVEEKVLEREESSIPPQSITTEEEPSPTIETNGDENNNETTASGSSSVDDENHAADDDDDDNDDNDDDDDDSTIANAMAQRILHTSITLWKKHLQPPLSKVWMKHIQPSMMHAIHKLIPEAHQAQLIKYYRMVVVPLMKTLQQALQQAYRVGTQALQKLIQQGKVIYEYIQEELNQRRQASNNASSS
eukprot:CAMPEP_0178928676 /NCGR_PEP_ID=MMETSP0786-20121207/20062_1 /TAXON_ID=186022 /ORGANISM="Thalassionema frauenfeldii, Strain CCMP 1798" /LENGTH=379 /DNA_ID=CAMNT_0020604619 /DNA_START=217 /DNA_END=1356 /DNA_ORIENTATION=+